MLDRTCNDKYELKIIMRYNSSGLTAENSLPTSFQVQNKELRGIATHLQREAIQNKIW